VNLVLEKSFSREEGVCPAEEPLSGRVNGLPVSKDLLWVVKALPQEEARFPSGKLRLSSENGYIDMKTALPVGTRPCFQKMILPTGKQLYRLSWH